MSDFQCFVHGIPKPAGSKRAFPLKTGRIVITDACKTSKDWKATVAATVMATWRGPPLVAEPVQLDVTFYMPRPKSHYRTGRHAGELRPNAPLFHITRPDSTKLLRCIEDALTGILWRDDSQIAIQTVRKMYGERPGAELHMREARSDGCSFERRV